MTSESRSRDRDRRFREQFASRPINVRELGLAAPPLLGPSVRRFPFPFRSALAISNDCRAMTPESFDEIHGAFADRNLEIGAAISFGKDEVCSVDSRTAERLHEAGLADSVFGLPSGGADAACAMLSKRKFAPLCYVGNPSVAVAAMLEEIGVRYFTDSAFTVGEKFGEGSDIRSTIRLRESFGRFDYDLLGYPPEEGGSDLDSMFESRSPADQRTFAVALFNAPLLTIDAGGGRTLNVFKRYRGPQRPAVPTLGLQVRSMHLDTLENEGGAIIVEQRLGETALLGQPPEREQRRIAQSPLLTTHELVALDELGQRAADRLLVTLPSRLLAWQRLRSCIRYELDETEDVWLIRITCIDGENGPISRSMLDGLAFTIPASAPRTIVLVEGESQPLETRREPDPALDGQDCVYLPWEKRPWPKR